MFARNHCTKAQYGMHHLLSAISFELPTYELSAMSHELALCAMLFTPCSLLYALCPSQPGKLFSYLRACPFRKSVSRCIRRGEKSLDNDDEIDQYLK